MEVADGYSQESEGWEADRCGHFADLAVAAFVEGEFDPRCGDVLADANRRIAGRNVGTDLFSFGG